MPIQLIGLCMMFAIALAVGQIFMKIAANDINLRLASMPLASAVQSPKMVLAIIVYGFITALWLFILTKAPLSRAYPFSLFGSALVPILAAAWFGDPLSLRYGLGLSVVLLGLAIMYVEW